MDPVTAAALEAGRRYVLGKLVRWTLVLLPLVLAAGMAAVMFTTLLFAGADDQENVTGSMCSAVEGDPAPLKGGDLTGEQVANAKIVVAVGRRLEVPQRGIVVALMTALQESTLQNIPYGDRDSVGLFQQRRPWGTTEERLDPATAATMFYTGGRGGQDGLLDIEGWKVMEPTVAAQSVQVSAFPTAYAKWESTALQLLGAKGMDDVRCTSTNISTSGIVKAAQKWMGTPYSWGGGGINGPSEGFGRGAGIVGFDCSSLVQNAVYASTGVLLPRTTTPQARVLAEVSRDAVQAGDLLFFRSRDAPPGTYHHVGIYDGHGGMIHAPRTGKTVERVANVFDNSYWAGQLEFIGRVDGGEGGDQPAPA